MPDTIDATVAGPSANSYVTVAFADAYFADTLEARQWLGFNREDRIRALLSATDRIEFDMRCFRFSGKSRWEQALTFPTEFDLDSEGNSCIPDVVQYATCELALAVLRGTATEDQLPRRVRKLLRPFLPAGGEQVPDAITSEELVGLSGEAAREGACTVCVDALQRAAHTIRELEKRVAELEKRAVPPECSEVVLRGVVQRDDTAEIECLHSPEGWTANMDGWDDEEVEGGPFETLADVVGMVLHIELMMAE